MKKILFYVLWLLSFVPSVWGTMVLGTHPFEGGSATAKKCAPLAAYLSKALNEPVEVVVSRNYADHVRAVREGRYDIMFVGPSLYAEATRQDGAVFPVLGALSIRGKSSFYGVIAVRNTSPLKEPEDLKGKRVAFGSPLSTMGHLVPRYQLLKKGLEGEYSFRFLSNHRNVALGVLLGDFDAGALKPEVFEHYRPQGLRALYRSPLYPEHLFLAAPRMKPETIEALRKALQEASQSEEGQAALEAFHDGLTAIVPASDHDYESMRTLIGTLQERGIYEANHP